MQSYFTSDFFAHNRARLRELAASTGPIVITANGLLQRGGDSSYAFCQDANFWYLTGINEPDITLVIDGENEYLIVPPRDASRQAFDGALDPAALSARSGIKTVLESAAGWATLNNGLKKSAQVATVAAPPAYIERYGLYANPAREHLIKKLKNVKIIDISKHIVHLRMVKQAPELAAIQSAIDITIDTIKDVAKTLKTGAYKHEYQLEADISQGFRRRGATGHAFDPIVAGGDRACTLHNVANNGRLSPNELIVVDVGAEVEHYAADITRTIYASKISPRAASIYEAVAEVQRYAFSLLKPGVNLQEYEKNVESFMGQKLFELGLIKTINHKNIRKYYPHATSHFLGLNVHDAGDYKLPLQAGMVLTVEPGIYVPQQKIGVRLEDDVLITKTGIKVLTKRLTSKLLYC